MKIISSMDFIKNIAILEYSHKGNVSDVLMILNFGHVFVL